MIKLYTIGFTGKSAEQFFNLLAKAGVKKIIDSRVNNVSQLAGFAKGNDLKYFAKAIGGIEYEHNLDFAPTKELLSDYRDKKVTWAEYEIAYLKLLEAREITKDLNIKQLHKTCLLCSEHEPDQCHRRILAEYIKTSNHAVEIIHLM
ncbi:MAG TPA: DUF488 domain-containing protein [Saprospiraceae bacterium]|nr:DUF488 domain-containing protein [Saprospiraceae bacterium]